MQGHELRVVEAFDQACKQRLANVATRGHHGQKMRLVRDQEMLVDVQHALEERNRCLVRHLAKVVHAQPGLVTALRLDRLAVRVQHLAAAHTVQPLLARDRGETRAQRIEHGHPISARQV